MLICVPWCQTPKDACCILPIKTIEEWREAFLPLSADCED